MPTRCNGGCILFPHILTRYYSGDQLQQNETGGACSTYGGGSRDECRVLVGDLKKSDHLED